MSERNIVKPEPREVGNHHRDANTSECLDPTAENKVFHNVDFYTEFPMLETKFEPHTENILVPEENLNDDTSKDSRRLQRHDHLRRPGELSFEYTELRQNHRSSSVDSTNFNALVPTMPINSAVDDRLKSECPPVYPRSLSGLPTAEVYNTVKFVPGGQTRKQPKNNQGQPAKSESNLQPFIPKYSQDRTDNSTPLASHAPSMDSRNCASLVCEIPRDSLQLRSAAVHAYDNVYENILNMDNDKPIMPVMSEPFEDNKVQPSAGPAHFETVMQQNPAGRIVNLPKNAFNVECNLNIHAETRGYQRNTLLMITDAFHVNLPLAYTANLKEKTFANAVKYHASLPNIPAISGYQGNNFLMSTEQSYKQDFMPSSAASPSTAFCRMQNPVERRDNLLTNSFNANHNLIAHSHIPGYQRNTLLANKGALHFRSPLAGTGYLTEKNFVNTNRNQSSMPNVQPLSGYQENSCLMPTEQLNTQYSVSSSAAGPSKGSSETFVYMDILNMSSVAGPSGYGIDSFVVPNVSESRVTPVSAGNRQFNYMCQFCDYKANSKSKLQNHIRVHTEERPFECSVCHLFFKTASALGGHIRSHRKGKTA